MAVRMRRSETGTGVPMVCANRLTRSSSICQRISLAASATLASGGKSASAAVYSSCTRCTTAICCASRPALSLSLSSRLPTALT